MGTKKTSFLEIAILLIIGGALFLYGLNDLLHREMYISLKCNRNPSALGMCSITSIRPFFPTTYNVFENQFNKVANSCIHVASSNAKYTDEAFKGNVQGNSLCRASLFIETKDNQRFYFNKHSVLLEEKINKLSSGANQFFKKQTNSVDVSITPNIIVYLVSISPTFIGLFVLFLACRLIWPNAINKILVSTLKPKKGNKKSNLEFE